MRDVHIRTSDEYKLKRNHLLKLFKPLYILADSSNYWTRTLKNLILNKMIITASSTCEAVSFRKIAYQLTGPCATHVHDCFHAENSNYSDLRTVIERKFRETRELLIRYDLAKAKSRKLVSPIFTRKIQKNNFASD